MNPPLIQIHDHGYRHLELASAEHSLDLRRPAEVRHDFHHQILANETDADFYQVVLKCELVQWQDGRQAGTWVKAELWGIFSVAADLAEVKRPAVVTFNGLSILYGLLRGTVSTLSPAFDSGKFTLPALMPQQLAGLPAGLPE